jgi:hypothetical protein
MPGRLITDPAEWEQITGLTRVRWVIELPPAKRRAPAKKSQEVFLWPHCLETLTSPRSGILRCSPCNKTWASAHFFPPAA